MRKLLSLLVFILLGVSLFAGGGGQAKDSSGPVKLRFLYPGTSEIERQWSTELAQRVKAAYPNYEIEFIYLVWADMEPKLVSMIQAQDYPDIIAVQETTNYVTMDALEPLDAYFDTGANPVKKSNLIQSALDHFSMSSKVYALPDRVVNYGMVVNEKLLSTVGVKPEDLKTWDDVKKTAALLTKGDIYGYAIAAGTARFAFRDGLIAAGSDGFSPDQVEKEKQYKEMLQFYKDMAPYMPKAQVTWAYPEMFTAFCDGRVGMIANGNYFSSNVFSINPEIIKVSRVIPFPRGPSASSAKGGSLVSSAGYAMVKGGKNKEAAWNILKLIADTDMAARSAAGINITAHLDVTTAMLKPYAQNIYPGVIDEHLKLVDAWSKIADSAGVAMPKIMGQSQMEPVFQKQLLDLIAGSISVDQAYATISSQIKNIKAQF